MKKKVIFIVLAFVMISAMLTGCDDTPNATNTTLSSNTSSATTAAANIVKNQPAPTDLNYSLERYNVIRRAYWVNGQREKANALVCSVEKPLGYIVLFSNSGAVVGNFVVDGKVSSLNSYLFPAYLDTTSDGITGAAVNESNNMSTIRTDGSVFSTEIPGIDGTYGSNVSGIFFFTTDGKYIEWTGNFLYSDIPFDVGTPILTVKGVN